MSSGNCIFHGFDRRLEHLCGRFYRGRYGRPSMAPGMSFRLLLTGYFESLDSGCGIACRVADSLSLRRLIGYGIDEKRPDHSTIFRTRRHFWLSTHRAVFTWVLKVLAEEGQVVGQTVSVDATTLEANEAMRSIVRRSDGQSYEAFVTALAEAEGIVEPTQEELARFDRKRKTTTKRAWRHPHDLDSHVTKMKDGRTHLANKAEDAGDLDRGVLFTVRLPTADQREPAGCVDCICAGVRISSSGSWYTARRSTWGCSCESLTSRAPRGGRRGRFRHAFLPQLLLLTCPAPYWPISSSWRRLEHRSPFARIYDAVPAAA